MRLCTLIVIVFTFFPGQSISADVDAHGLNLSYSRDTRICKEASELISADKSCRPFDSFLRCEDEETFSILVRGKRLLVFEEVATNQYGYTRIYRSIGSSLNGFAIIYVERFLGLRVGHILETWKVDATVLDEVLKIPPGPIPYKQWVNMKPMPSRETNALEFSEMLRRSEKLENDWSPVIDIFGEPYLIERECSGSWDGGGYYNCGKVIKLTVKKLFKDKKAVPYCQFSKAKKKKE